MSRPPFRQLFPDEQDVDRLDRDPDPVPLLDAQLVQGVKVITDSICAPPAIRPFTWHMPVPRLISVTSPSSRFRAPIFIAHLLPY